MEEKYKTQEEAETQDMGAGQKSNREMFFENIKNKYADKEFANDDEVYGTAMEGYDKDHESLKKIYSENEQLVNRLQEDPRVGAFISDILSGKTLPQALAGKYTIEELTMQEGDDGYDEYMQSIESEKTSKQKIEALKKEYEANLVESEKEINAFAEEQGMTPEEVTKFIEDASKVVFEPLAKGKFTKSNLTTLKKMIDYDKDIEIAKSSSYVKGKNEKIIEKKMSATDRLPDIKSSTDKGIAEPTSPISIRKDAFEMGGYKKSK